jgi:hypothetical protein
LIQQHRQEAAAENASQPIDRIGPILVQHAGSSSPASSPNKGVGFSSFFDGHGTHYVTHFTRGSEPSSRKASLLGGGNNIRANLPHGEAGTAKTTQLAATRSTRIPAAAVHPAGTSRTDTIIGSGLDLRSSKLLEDKEDDDSWMSLSVADLLPDLDSPMGDGKSLTGEWHCCRVY